MRARWLLLLVGGLALPSFVGCSLMNLDDFTERRCHSDDDCSRAEERFGDAPHCQYYVCSDGRCVPKPGTETCNGEDDDCNGVIDDGLAPEAHELKGTTSPSATFAYATTPSKTHTAYVVAGEPGAAGLKLVVANDTSIEPAVPLSYASNAAKDNRVCPTFDGELVTANDCNFNDVAVAVDAAHLVYATINTVGCAAGQLRVGLADEGQPSRVWLGSTLNGEEERLSNVEAGVDTGGGNCSGASLPSSDGLPSGARSPALATVDTSPGGVGALVVWLGTNFAAPAPSRCASSSFDVPVQALSLFVPVPAPGVPEQLHGHGDGLPLTVGPSSTLTPPAVVALTRSQSRVRYLVAFPSLDEGTSGIGIFFVDAPTSGTVPLVKNAVAFIPAPFPDSVALANDGQNPPKNMAIAWLSGCDGQRSLEFATLTLSGDELVLSPTASTPAPNAVAKPQLLYRPDGFTTGPRPGGWYVLWSEGLMRGARRTRLARFGADGPSIAMDVTTVTSGASGFPILFPSGDAGLNQGLVQVAAGKEPALSVFEGWCH